MSSSHLLAINLSHVIEETMIHKRVNKYFEYDQRSGINSSMTIIGCCHDKDIVTGRRSINNVRKY